jgi:hypothetical protein
METTKRGFEMFLLLKMTQEEWLSIMEATFRKWE